MEGATPIPSSRRCGEKQIPTSHPRQIRGSNPCEQRHSYLKTLRILVPLVLATVAGDSARAADLILDGITYLFPGNTAVYDNIVVGNLATGTLLQNAGSLTASSGFALGRLPGATGVFNLGGGTFFSPTLTNVGESGTGTLTISGGTFDGSQGFNNFSSIGFHAGSLGTVNLSGTGSMQMAYEVVGYSGTGVVNQSGGTHTVGGTFYVGYQSGGQGTYNLSGGTLDTSFARFPDIIGSDPGALGAFHLSGSGIYKANTIAVGYQGTGSFTLSGSGSFEALDLTVCALAGTGTFTQTGGTNTVSRTLAVGAEGGLGTYDLSGGTLSSTSSDIGGIVIGVKAGGTGIFSLSGSGNVEAHRELVGNEGTGTFNQSGGTHTISLVLVMGNASGGNGTYNLSGGTLDAGSAGNQVIIGAAVGSTGAFNLSGSGTFDATQIFIGNRGTGTFTQTGGTISVSDVLYVGYAAGGQGTYHLNGGVLQAGSIGGGLGASTFNFNGGTLQANGTNPSYFGSIDNLNVRDGGAKFDTNGFATTITVALPHSTIGGDAAIDGGLTKLGAGLLSMSGSAANTYTGDTQVNGGTLRLAKTGAGAANNFGPAMGGNLVVNNGGTARYGANSQVRDGKNITVNAGGLLDLNGFADSITDLSVNGGSVTTGAGYLNVRGSVISNSLVPGSYTGNLHLESLTAGTLHTVSVTGASLTISGPIGNGDNGLAAGLEKTDLFSLFFPSGTLILSGSAPNTYTGLTKVDYGTLILAKNGAGPANNFGAAMGGNLQIGLAGIFALHATNARYDVGSQVRDDMSITVNVAGTLDLNGFSDTITNLILNGGSVTTGTGSLNVRGTVSAGPFALASSSTGNLRLESPVAGGLREVSVADNATFAISGVVLNGENGLAAGLNKTGLGTLTFSGSAANLYTGETQVNGGTLFLEKTGAGLANNFGPAMAGDLVINSGGTARYGADSQVRDDKDITVNAGGLLDLNGFAESMIDLSINGGSVTTGTGYLNVRGSVSAGNSPASSYTGNLHLESPTNGGLRDVSVASGGTFTITGVVGNGDNGLPAGLSKTGAGTLTFNGADANIYLGETQVNGGTLFLARTSAGFPNNFGAAMGGNLVVNNGGTARYGADSQVRDAKNITVNAGGLLDLNGFAESITNLAINGGSVTTGAGYINVRGSVSADSSTTSSYTGNLHLESPTVNGLRDVSVGAGGTFSISGVVSNGDNGRAIRLSKTGAGTLSFSGSSPNTYTGETQVNAGTLLLSKTGPGFANDFGAAIAGNLVVNNGGTARYGASSQVRDAKDITVNAGGTLDLNGFGEGITNLTINGGTVATGIGSVSVGGSVSADSSTTSSLGNLGLSTAIANEARLISVASGGVFTISGMIFDARGLSFPTGLDKTGAGTLDLTAASTYRGGTTVSDGTLLANNPSGSATGPGSVTVDNGGILGGSGRVAGAVIVNSGGVVAPGNSPGRLNLGSSLLLPSGATLDIELGGTTPGTQYDQLFLSGLLTLGGNLNVSLVDGFIPTLDFVFEIVGNAGSTATGGIFANAPGGIYTSDAGIFSVNYAANIDGGTIPNDITLTYRAVPEPSTGALLAFGATVGAFLRPRGQRRR